MIMPCMNSTSAGERGGSFAVVEEGSLLLGLPGAPGWTTTEGAGPLCCARTAEQSNPDNRLDVRTASARAGRSLRLRNDRVGRLANGLNLVRMKLYYEIVTLSKALTGRRDVPGQAFGLGEPLPCS